MAATYPGFAAVIAHTLTGLCSNQARTIGIQRINQTTKQIVMALHPLFVMVVLGQYLLNLSECRGVSQGGMIPVLFLSTTSPSRLAKIKAMVEKVVPLGARDVTSRSITVSQIKGTSRPFIYGIFASRHFLKGFGNHRSKLGVDIYPGVILIFTIDIAQWC
ncbi:MAG: hypothetical protein PHQ43_02900 [Dehalococcoidales bacterium]|nr:hypothetical protein [Dehalococcoidales bacterium]